MSYFEQSSLLVFNKLNPTTKRKFKDCCERIEKNDVLTRRKRQQILLKIDCLQFYLLIL